MKNPDEIQYIKLLDDYFWSAYNQGVAIGTLDFINTYAYETLDAYPEYVVDNKLYSILDTGSSAINFSSLYFEDYIAKIYEYIGTTAYDYTDGIVTSQCFSNFPDLWFLFSNKWIRVASKDYVVDVSANQDNSICQLLIIPSATPLHILGMPLFIDYYTVHDMDEGTIGFVPHSVSSKD